MTQFIIFMVGSMFGSFVGVSVMCHLQINRTKENLESDEIKDDEKNS